MLPETKELIQGINQKDEKAWKVLFKSFYAPLCHYSSRILADEQVVPDIVQNTLVNLWNSSVRFENGKALTVYLYRAVWNNALKYLRDRNVEEERLKHWFEEEGEMSEENFYASIYFNVPNRIASSISNYIHEIQYRRTLCTIAN